jgi:hypothetical protein
MNKTRIVHFDFLKCCDDTIKNKFSITEYADTSFCLDIKLHMEYDIKNKIHSIKGINTFEIPEDKLTKFILEYSKYIIKIENE